MRSPSTRTAARSMTPMAVPVHSRPMLVSRRVPMPWTLSDRRRGAGRPDGLGDSGGERTGDVVDEQVPAVRDDPAAADDHVGDVGGGRGEDNGGDQPLGVGRRAGEPRGVEPEDRKSTRLNSRHLGTSY